MITLCTLYNCFSMTRFVMLNDSVFSFSSLDFLFGSVWWFRIWAHIKHLMSLSLCVYVCVWQFNTATRCCSCWHRCGIRLASWHSACSSRSICQGSASCPCRPSHLYTSSLWWWQRYPRCSGKNHLCPGEGLLRYFYVQSLAVRYQL